MPLSLADSCKAIKTLGNGNCLYNAVSYHFTGDESLAVTLRLLTAVELFTKSGHYEMHPHLTTTATKDGVFSKHPDTLFSVLLTDDASSVFTSGKNRKRAIEAEALDTLSNFKWSSMLHVLALATVIDMPIYSVYPEVNLAIRSMLD